MDGVEDIRTIESLEVAWETDGDADTEANVQPFTRERESELQELNDMKGSFRYDEMLKNDEILLYNTLTEHMQEVRSMFVSFFAMMVGLSAFIIGFALINLVNTMVTGILTRDHEFAILQSVGMTRTQLSGMLRTEGTLLAAGNIRLSSG